MRGKRRTKAGLLVSFVFAVVMVLSFTATANAATGVNVDTHSPEQIRAYFKSIESRSFAVTYDIEPVLTAPYSPGALSQETLQGAIDVLNGMRYIAGIPYNVRLNEEYNQMAQAGALVNAVNNVMSHKPTQPDGMDDSLYQLGKDGCGSSNLYWNVSNFKDAVEGWVSDERNRSGFNQGHRRWCLNPSMQYTGFGKAGAYSAMYAFDNLSGSTAYTGVAWPAQQMPLQFFDTDVAWSVSFGRSVSETGTSVTLTRTRDNKVWNFSSTAAEGGFLVENSNYGQPGCVIFLPNNVGTYLAGDVFHVQITENGSIIADYDVNFFDMHPVESISLDKTDITLEEGEKTSIRATVSPYDASNKTVTWTTSDATVAAVDRNGNVTAVKAGSAQIIAADSTGNVMAVCNVTVTEPTIRDIGTQDISLSFSEAVYTGSQVKPTVKVTGLTEGTDYRVEYSNNVNAGTAKVKIIGINRFKGSVEKNFTIKPKNIDQSKITYSGTGSNMTASIPGLVLKKDYTVKVTTDSSGEITITVTGIGNYTGTVSKTVKPATALDVTKVKLAYTETVYDGSYKKPQVTIAGLKEGNDYAVAYSNNRNAGTAAVLIEGIGEYTGQIKKSFVIKAKEITADDVTLEAVGTDGKARVTVNGLTAGRDYTCTYYYMSQTGEIRVRVEGINNCTGLVRKSVYVTGYKIVEQMFFVTPASFMYSGSACKPEISIGILVENVDYKVSYKDNVNAGTASVTVTGIGKYSGSVTKTFQIKPAHINKLPVKCSYDKDTKKVNVTVPGLVEGKDFTVTVTNSGTTSLRVRVKGIGNYTNSVTETIKLDAEQLDAKAFSLSYTSTTYTGTEKKPSVKNDGSLKSSDYTVSYADNVNAGTGIVYIKGKGRYTGTVSLTFEILPKQLNKSDVKVSVEQAEIKVSVSGLTEKKDYVVSAGEDGAVTVKGIGNYTGTVTVERTVIDDEIDNANGNTPVKPAKVTLRNLTTSKKHTIKVTWKKVTCSGYQIRYSTSKSFKTYKTLTVKKGSTVSKNISKLKKGKTYYVKVRAYKTANGKKVYGAFSTVKKTKCK